MFREHPTLPANPDTVTQPLQEALRDDCGLSLPRKHCAFKGCGWNGPDAFSFTKHIDDCHRPVLAASMEAYKALRPVHRKDEATLAASMYNEGIAIAIPLSDSSSVSPRRVTGVAAAQSTMTESALC